MSKLYKSLNKSFPVNGRMAKAASMGFVLGIFYGITNILASYSFPNAGQIEAVIDLQNFGRIASIFAVMMVVLLLVIQQDSFLWFSRARTSKLDERELGLQRKILERSYKVAILSLVIGLWQVMIHKTNIITALQHSLSNDWLWIPINVLLLLIALPMLMTAWRTDTSFEESPRAVTKKPMRLLKPLLIAWLFVPLAFVVSFVANSLTNAIGVTSPISGGLTWLLVLSMTVALGVTLFAFVVSALRTAFGKN